MPESMKAFVMKGIGEAGFVEKPIPAPGPNDVIVKTTAASVSSSDLLALKGRFGERIDTTLGHEAVGVVYRTGSHIRGFKPGDRVAVGAVTPCFRCENCQRGYPSQCTKPLGGWRFGHSKDGVLAEYFHVNDAEANLAPIPESVSDEAAVYVTEVMSTGFKGAENADIPPGGVVAVFGLGPVGLMATAACRLRGAGLVVAVDCLKPRMDLAEAYGADRVLNFQDLHPEEEIIRITGGEGVDASIEAVGSQEAFEACIKVTRPGGTISVAGYYGEGDYVNIPRMDWGVGAGEKTIRTLLSPGGRERLGRLLRLIRTGRVDPTKMTTHRFPFGEVDRAFHLMETRKDGIIKPFIYFDA